eukprot:TRINITY_DN15547_c0_g1_i4.p1 TRINITY_DN15547_c0_g1~~TRINITY_DN15547_c0_g1_i4.p1  ORF type:complete len:184 (-),score=74.21 TRINITY_DN15547_c0_g1_i4:448-936(-)
MLRSLVGSEMCIRDRNIPMIEQVNKLQDENKLLKKRLQDAEAQISGLGADLEGAAEQSAQTSEDKAAAISKLQAELAALQDVQGSTAEESDHRAQELQAKLSALEAGKRDAEKELAKKVYETTQYQNLKKMLVKKTQQNKEYKAELMKLCPEKFADEAEDDE